MADAAKLRALLEACARTIDAHAPRLTELDAAIGDADHGSNMAKGFRAVLEKTPVQADLGAMLKAAGMALIASVGGASGPLYGTAFLRAGQALSGKTEAGVGDLVPVLRSALEGIQQRGKASVGEKTMLDTLVPALSAFEQALAAGGQGGQALGAMAEAARSGMAATVPLKATKGRASYLGERSIGHQDPGATSCYLILATIAHSCGAPVADPAEEAV